MSRPNPIAWAAAAILAGGAIAYAQKTTEVHPGRGGSPHVRTEWTIDGANISIEYGRPFVKGRKIFGDLVPFGAPWRTGADEVTTLKSDKTLVIGGVDIPAGAHSLFTLPGETAWKLIVNKQTGQNGTEYDEKQDLARIDMRSEKLAEPVEQLTITLEKRYSGGGAMLGIAWADRKATVGVNVKP
jgi:hypothetical protein